MTDSFGTLYDLAHARRSVRAFRPDPVPEPLLREVLALAQQAPSNCNTQPWVVHLVSGEASERMRGALYETAASRRPVPDYPFTGPYEGIHRERQIDSAKALYGAMGIGRDDKAARGQAMMENFRFFGAPHALFLFMHERFGPREAADCGMYAQTLLLALTARGIGSCAQGALGHHADIVRAELGVDASHRLLFGIAIGWEDGDHPANRARVGRASVDDAVTFHR